MTTKIQRQIHQLISQQLLGKNREGTTRTFEIDSGYWNND